MLFGGSTAAFGKYNNILDMPGFLKVSTDSRVVFGCPRDALGPLA